MLTFILCQDKPLIITRRLITITTITTTFYTTTTLSSLMDLLRKPPPCPACLQASGLDLARFPARVRFVIMTLVGPILVPHRRFSNIRQVPPDKPHLHHEVLRNGKGATNHHLWTFLGTCLVTVAGRLWVFLIMVPMTG